MKYDPYWRCETETCSDCQMTRPPKLMSSLPGVCTRCFEQNKKYRKRLVIGARQEKHRARMLNNYYRNRDKITAQRRARYQAKKAELGLIK